MPWINKAGEDEDASQHFDLGPCCACGQEGTAVCNVVMLDRRVPPGYEGTGWGCMSCGLPADGACVVLCDECLADTASWRHAVLGYPLDKQRVGLETLSVPFEHGAACGQEEEPP
jgi:hypothetical protein